MRIDNFRSYDLYKVSVALSFSVYKLLLSSSPSISNETFNYLHRMAISIPKQMASGIGQTNMKTRFKRLNMVKDYLVDLEDVLNTYPVQDVEQTGYALNAIDINRVELMKLLNGYFGWLKRNKGN